MEKQKRSKSLQPGASTVSDLKRSSVDSSQGFKVIRQGRSEEDLDDLCSLYSEPDYNSDSIGGKLQLGIWYRVDEMTLYVRIAKGKELASIGEAKPDPYIRMHLLPDKTKLTKRRTGIQRKTNTPEFNEILKVSICVIYSLKINCELPELIIQYCLLMHVCSMEGLIGQT